MGVRLRDAFGAVQFESRGGARGNAPDAGDDGVEEGPREPLLPPSQAPPPRARAPGLGSTM